MRNREKKRRFRWGLWLLVAIAGLFSYFAGFHRGPKPELAIHPALQGVGVGTSVEFLAQENDRGLSGCRVELTQGERTDILFEDTWVSRPSWNPWGAKTELCNPTLEVGRNHQDWLEEGTLTLRFSAWGAPAKWRQAQGSVEEISLQVDLRPPVISVVSNGISPKQGGSEVVVYRLSEESPVHGVQAGESFFPGWSTGSPGLYFSLFSAPWFLDNPNEIRLIAKDELGNESKVPFLDSFTSRPLSASTITLSDRFLGKVVSEILAQTPALKDQGSPIANYLAINGELRKKNRAFLADLAKKSPPSFLWTQTFEALPDSKVMSSFATRRFYEYRGELVDEQVHLGFDQASVRRASVPAANDGHIAYAAYLGIYGNVVVVDHGYGLLSLYAHLSSIDVEQGDAVKRGQKVGSSGATGLAGGDHLHFGIFLQGVPVDPLEWWDRRWIQNRIAEKLDPALFPFGSTTP